MFDKEIGSSLEMGIIRMACAVILLGAAAIRLLDWSILGWALVGIGLLTLWLAYLIATAPCYVEPLAAADHTRV